MVSMEKQNEILPPDEFSVHIRHRKDLPQSPFEVSVERLYAEGDEPSCYVAHAYSKEEIEPAMLRAKQKLTGQAPPKTMLAPALVRV